MKIGPLVRRLLPPRVEVEAAKVYRRVFAYLDEVPALLAERLPARAIVLDIGGGDGDILNRLLSIRDDIGVTILGVAESVGQFLKPDLHSRTRAFLEITL